MQRVNRTARQSLISGKQVCENLAVTKPSVGKHGNHARDVFADRALVIKKGCWDIAVAFELYRDDLLCRQSVMHKCDAQPEFFCNLR